jgi:hypothetical protein
MNATRDELRKAYRAGKASWRTDVDSDVAVARWITRHATPATEWALTNAWYDGFEWGCHDDRPAYMERS